MRPKKDKIPDFSFNDLHGSMREAVEHAAGKTKVRTLQIKARPASLSGRDIAKMRGNPNVGRAVFADLLNVSKATVVSRDGQLSESGMWMVARIQD